jgi:dihydroorotate dehydrogenase
VNLYTRAIFPALRRIDPETAHELALSALGVAQRFAAGRVLLRALRGPVPEHRTLFAGLEFVNELGVAAGYDKDARVPLGLSQLGFGHVEVGTLTPRPQAGNRSPRLFRLPEDQALINRMGFPNVGGAAAAERLRRLYGRDRQLVIGVSLGKQKETALTDAPGDYCHVMRLVFPFADYFAINVSSPNTPELRSLQFGHHLAHLLDELTSVGQELAAGHGVQPKPLLLKIAPDMVWSELDQILTAIETHGVAGIIATNTSTSREGLRSTLAVQAGGLSGRPLKERALEVVRYIHRRTSGRLPIIGVGGIQSADDARAMLDAGAILVQLYTGLVYEGPGIGGRILRDLHS